MLMTLLQRRRMVEHTVGQVHHTSHSKLSQPSKVYVSIYGRAGLSCFATGLL